MNAQPKNVNVEGYILGDENCDIKLLVQGRVINAHKYILYTKSVFFQELFNKNPKRDIVIFTTMSYDILHLVIKSMYTRTLVCYDANKNEIERVLQFVKVIGCNGDAAEIIQLGRKYKDFLIIYFKEVSINSNTKMYTPVDYVSGETKAANCLQQ